MTVGDVPFSVAVGDFNGDGKQDLAIANSNSNNVSIRLGDGAGGFTSPGIPEVTVGSTPRSVAIGDFNGDGKQDLAIANTISNKVSIRLGDGAGGFTSPATPEVTVGSSPVSVAIGDFNNDGRLDLAVANGGSNSISVRLGNGAGGFNSPSPAEVTVGSIPESVAIGDFNNDGRQDFATANQTSANVSIRLGDGLGHFFSPPAPQVSVGSQPFSVVIGDFNNDGKQDFAAANSVSNNVSIRLGDGLGGFNSPATPQVSVGNSPFSLAVGDLNNDGIQDWAVANQNSNNVSIRLGACNFAPTIAAAAGLSRQQGSSASNSTIATVTDDGGNANLTVKVNGSISATVNGVTVSNILNTGGTITADVIAACGATNASFALQASDGSTTVTTQLSVSIIANALPTLTYNSPQSVAFMGSLNVSATSLGDNGSIGFAVQSVSPALTTAPSVNSAGVVSITNATPAGNHTITIRATDNCGATTDSSFTVNVAKAASATTLSSSPNPSAAGDNVTFTATVSSPGGTPTGTVTFNDNGSAIASCTSVVLNSGQASCTTSSLSVGNHTVTADYSGDTNFNPSTATLAGGQTVMNGLSFSQSLYTVGERGGSVTITVQRTGDTSQAAAVDYATDDGSIPTVVIPCSTASGAALERCDYERAAGTLTFAAGETQKTFAVLINDDSYVEGPETATLRLSNPFGAALGQQSTATLQITDDVPESAGNAIDDDQKFVVQHYRDFLNREPDPTGLQFWTNQMTNCGAADLLVCRVNVSAAFFLSIEYQNTGYFVYRTYKSSFGDLNPPTIPVPVRVKSFLIDTEKISQGVIVGQGNWQQQLADNKQAFALAFVQRPDFLAHYPASTSAAAFVNSLDGNAGNVLTTSEKDALISQLSPNPSDINLRANVVKQVAENTLLQQKEFNRAFVLMQYFGYLRRNPDDAPDFDFSGFNFWLNKLNSFNGDFQKAEMVKAFITSSEYRKRFGP